MTANDIALIVAVATVAVAVGVWLELWQNRIAARVRNTLEFIQDYNNNSRVEKAHDFLRQIKKRGEDEKIAAYGEASNRADFLFLMNKFEMLAIGLKRGVYDKKMIESAFGYDVFRIYNYAETLINHCRGKEDEPDPQAYAEYEKLANHMRYKHGKRKPA